MPMLATILILLAAPAAVDRSTTFTEVEATPATPTPMSVRSADSSPATPEANPREEAPPAQPPIAIVPTPLPVPPPPPAPPARPIRWRVDIVASSGGTRIGDPGWRAFDDNRHVWQPTLTLRADARVGGSRVFLGGGASFRSFGGGGSLYQSTWSNASIREPLLFARLAVVAVEGVDVFVHAGGGPSVVDLSFSSNQFASQRSVAGMVDGQGGVALYLPKRWLRRRGASRVTGGLELAAGYTWRSPIDVRPQLSTVEDPIPSESASLGDLSLRGFAWRVGVFVRFQ